MYKIQKLLFLILIFTLTLNAKDYILENRGVKRILSVDDHLSTTFLENKYSGEGYQIVSDEFKVMIDDYKADFTGKTLTARDFIVVGEPLWTGTVLEVLLKNADYEIEARITYDATKEFYIRKKIEFTSHTLKRNISTIEVERMIINGADISYPSHVFKGNTPADGPVYVDNFFFGLEYPKQDNSMDGKYLRLRHFPGQDLAKGESCISKTAVIGASPNTPLNRLKDTFFKYIDEYRGTKVRNFKVYNTWFLLVFDQKEESLLKAIETHVKPLYDRGIILDGFVVDDGWQDRNTMWEVNHEFLPGGIGPDSPLQKAIKKYDSNLHLWMPLTGQYGLAERGKETEWYESGGYNTGSNWSLCLKQGSKIFEDKKSRILELMDLGCTSIKSDFAYIGCDKEGHGHLANNFYGIEATVDGVIDIIESAREIQPELFYYLTTEINHNPWWLKTNDILWESFGGDIKTYTGNDEPTEAQQRMSGRDEYHYQHCMKWFIPQTSYMTHGIISSCQDDGLYATLQEHIDNAILYYARGVMWSEIYVTGMNDDYWDALADVIKWSDANWEILTTQPAMSGAPSEGKPYFWSHFKDKEGLVILRNPTGHVRGIDIPLGESSRMPEFKGQIYRAEVIKVSGFSKVAEKQLGTYQYGQSVPVTLNPWEVKVVKISPTDTIQKTVLPKRAETDLGIVKVGEKINFQLSVMGDNEFEIEISDKWLTKKKFLKDTYLVNTKGLEFSTAYSGKINIVGAGFESAAIVTFETDIDPDQKVFYLSDMEPLATKQDWGNLNRNKSVDGNPLTIGGKVYEKGLGTHANSEIEYDLSRFNACEFLAFVGQDKETNGSITFQIFLDMGHGYTEKPAFESGILRREDGTVDVKLDITNAQKLKLITTDGGDNINGDHADWGDARIIRR